MADIEEPPSLDDVLKKLQSNQQEQSPEQPKGLDEVLASLPKASDIHPMVADESMLGKAWRIATTPLTNLGSRASEALQAPYNPIPEQSQEVQNIPVVGGMLNTGMNVFNATQKALLGGAGHFVDEQSSPLNLALMASGLGETKMAGNLIGDAGRTAASYATRALSAPIAIHGASEVYNEPTIGGKLGGGLELALGGLGMFHGSPSTREAITSPEAPPTEVAPEIQAPIKRNIKINGDGTFTDKNTGEVFDKKGNPIGTVTPENTGTPKAEMDPELTVPEPPKVIPKLPADLKGAKPRYGDKTVDFSNDLDRALYIIAQKEPSRRDADYMKWLVKSTGLDEATLRTMGREYKAHLGSTLKDPDFNGTVPSFHDWQDLLPDAPIRGLGGKVPPPPTSPTGDITSPSSGRALKPGQDDTLGNWWKNTSGREKVVDALNVPRAIMASTDMSAPLRQGLPMIHRGEWWAALKPMMQSAFSEDTYNQVRQSIDSKPLFQVGPEGQPSFAKQAGLFLSDLGHLSDREEAIMSGLAERLPLGAGKVIRGSNRAYTTFLNKLRADTFENMVTKLGAQNDPMLTKGIANYINNSTGRGSLGKFEQAAQWMNTGLFAPRNIAAKFTTMNPAYYVNLPPPVRKEALKSMLSVVGVGMSMGALAKMSGAQVSYDPTSTEFGKIKIGNTRLDPFGGYQQYAVPAARLLDWAISKSTGATNGTVYSSIRDKDYNIKPINEIGNFWRKKENPVLSFAHGMLSGQNAIGQPFQAEPELRNMFVPMVLQDLADVAKNDPDLLPLTIPLSVLGMGVQSYKSNTDRYTTGNR